MRKHLSMGYIHAMAHAAGMAAVAAQQAKMAPPPPPPEDNHVRPGPTADTVYYRGQIARKVDDDDIARMNAARAKRAKKREKALRIRDRQNAAGG